MDLLAGREGFAPDLPHSYEPTKLLGETAHQIPNVVAIQRPRSRQFSRTFTGIIDTPYPESLTTGSVPAATVVVA